MPVFFELLDCYYVVLLCTPCPLLGLRKEPPLDSCKHTHTHTHTHTRTHTHAHTHTLSLFLSLSLSLTHTPQVAGEAWTYSMMDGSFWHCDREVTKSVIFDVLSAAY